MANLVDSQIREIDELTTDWMLQNPIPGASVVLVDEEGELYAEGFGTSDLKTNEPVIPDTLFGMGSIGLHPSIRLSKLTFLPISGAMGMLMNSPLSIQHTGSTGIRID